MLYFTGILPKTCQTVKMGNYFVFSSSNIFNSCKIGKVITITKRFNNEGVIVKAIIKFSLTTTTLLHHQELQLIFLVFLSEKVYLTDLKCQTSRRKKLGDRRLN